MLPLKQGRRHAALGVQGMSVLFELLNSHTPNPATPPLCAQAMFQGLEDGLSSHGGSASIAFNGGKTGKGRQLMSKDRQVWGSLQEWLRNIFVDCCKIDGRDRRLMDEMYATLHAYHIAHSCAHSIVSQRAGFSTVLKCMRTRRSCSSSRRRRARASRCAPCASPRSFPRAGARSTRRRRNARA